MKYETLSEHYVKYGRNKFLEVTLKKIAAEEETEFINIAKGYYTPEGEKRYQRGIGFPADKDLLSSLADTLSGISKESD